MAEAPVKVIRGDAAFSHTSIVPDMLAVGNGFRVTVALPMRGPPPGHPGVVSETRVYTPGVLVVITYGSEPL